MVNIQHDKLRSPSTTSTVSSMSSVTVTGGADDAPKRPTEPLRLVSGGGSAVMRSYQGGEATSRHRHLGTAPDGPGQKLYWTPGKNVARFLEASAQEAGEAKEEIRRCNERISN